VRESPDARRNVVGGPHGFAGDGFGRALNHSSELMEIEIEHGQMLADIVVQLARDASALHFLCGEQPSSQFTDARKARAQLRFGPPASGAMHEESDDQAGLHAQQCHSTDSDPRRWVR
jgi:hypothetical protein